MDCPAISINSFKMKLITHTIQLILSLSHLMESYGPKLSDWDLITLAIHSFKGMLELLFVLWRQLGVYVRGILYFLISS